MPDSYRWLPLSRCDPQAPRDASRKLTDDQAMTCVFFYGLFMDADLLRDMGYRPLPVARALLRDYELRIGERAALTPRAGAVSYGMLIELTGEDLSALYSAPGVRDYRPISVETERLDGGGTQRCLCYTISADELGVEFNAGYAKALSSVLRKLGFPSHYADAVNRPDA